MNLRQLRRSLGLRQRDVAREAGVSVRALSKWERGLELPSDEAFGSLARVFGVDVTALGSGQRAFVAGVTPGEGYTTSKAGQGAVVSRRTEPHGGRR